LGVAGLDLRSTKGKEGNEGKEGLQKHLNYGLWVMVLGLYNITDYTNLFRRVERGAMEYIMI
jgi:hypothetical protein